MQTFVIIFELALMVLGAAIALALYIVLMGTIIAVAIMVQQLREMRAHWAPPFADDRAR